MDKIEIPFGAYDSETLGWTYTIPKGYTAKIKDGKIIVKKEELEDEKFRKYILAVCKECVEANDKGLELSMSTTKKLLAYLEKQKEQKPDDEYMERAAYNHAKQFESNGDFSKLYDTFRAGYFYAHRNSQTQNYKESEKYSKGFVAGHKAGWRAGQKYVFNNLYLFGLCKPAEWSEEDEEVMEDLYNFVISDFIQSHIHETRWKPWKTTLERNRQNRLKSLRPQYHGDVTMTEAYKMGLEAGKASSWKPSEEQMKALFEAVDEFNGYPEYNALKSLYDNLQKLM